MLHNLKYLPRDTSLEAARVMFAVVRSMPPLRNTQLRADSNEFLRGWQRSAIRNRHPEYSAEQVEMALRRLRLGDELFSKAYPGVDVQI